MKIDYPTDMKTIMGLLYTFVTIWPVMILFVIPLLLLPNDHKLSNQLFKIFIPELYEYYSSFGLSSSSLSNHLPRNNSLLHRQVIPSFCINE